MRWTKASERLPETNTAKYLKVDGDQIGTGYLMEQTTGFFSFKYWSSEYSDDIRYDRVEWLDESESSSPSHNDIVQEMEKRVNEIDSQPASTARAIEKIILRKYIPKLKQIGEGSESYWKKRCEGLYRALQGLVKDVRSKPNDTRYNTHLKIAEAVLKSSIGEETDGQDG